MQTPSTRTAIVLLGLIVIASGCADNSSSGVTVNQEKGVSIESFTATPNDIFENQLVTLELQLKNVGGSQAKNVVARLYNVPFQGQRSWDIQSPSSGQKIRFNNLRAPNPETDAPAISVPRTWSIRAPDLQQGVTIPYDFYTRVFYQYETTGTAEIQAMSDQRYRQSGATRSKPSMDNSGGPIQMEIRTRTPLIFFQQGESSSTQRSDVCVVVKNTGSGTPFLKDAYDEGTQSYSVQEQHIDKVELSLTASGDRVSGISENSQEVSMVGGKGVQCFTLEIGRVSTQDIQQTIPLTVTAEYGYYQDTSTSVTVNGRAGGSGGESGGEESGDDSNNGDETNSDEPESGPSSPSG